MNARDEAYVGLLHVGLLLQRDALLEHDHAFAYELAEYLHNIPSLIGESNAKRHDYFWNQEREHFAAWVERDGSPRAKSRVAMLCEPWWNQLRALQSRELEAVSG